MTSFWERRRAAVAAEAEADVLASKAAELAEVEAAQAEKSDEELLEELGLPDPDTLGEGADFKQFLTEAVPSRLKTRALRRLWRVNPVLANLDGLIDYGEDFTDSAMVVENLQTAYQVGKGMLAHVEELAKQAEEADADEPEVAVAEDIAPNPEAELLVTVEDDTKPTVAIDEQQIEIEEDYIQARTSRRMVFTFEEERVG